MEVAQLCQLNKIFKIVDIKYEGVSNMDDYKILALSGSLDAEFSNMQIKAILIQLLLRVYSNDENEVLNFLEKVKLEIK